MKTTIKALIIAIIMIASQAVQSASFNTLVDNVTICPDQDTMSKYDYYASQLNLDASRIAADYVRNGVCASIPKTTRFEILRYNSNVAEVVLYDQAGNLLKDQPVWVRMMHVNKKDVASATTNLADRVKGIAKAPVPVQQGKNVDQDMDAFLRNAITTNPQQQDQDNQGD